MRSITFPDPVGLVSFYALMTFNGWSNDSLGKLLKKSETYYCNFNSFTRDLALFKKLFSRNKSPTNGGTSEDAQLGEFKLVKRFDVVLANMEETPTYKLSHQLTIGSQVGNVVINDPTVSPRHCTFILKDDVVSILDHGSVSGTFVNGQKISPGKNIILEETDLIKVGDLEVRLSMRTERIEVKKEEPKPEEIIPQERTGIRKLPPKKKSFFELFKKKKSKIVNNNDLALNKIQAANTVIRIFAITGDLLAAYAIFIILNPFDEYRIFINDLPAMTGEVLGLDWNGFWDALTADYPIIEEVNKEVSNFSLNLVFLKPTFINFALIRIFSTLLFGVSFTEGLIGIRSSGNVIWKRIGGVLRVLIGFITAPFFIFDLPAIVSRKTLKEFLTFTTLTVPSKALSFLGVIIFIPALIASVLVAPLFQGLDIPEPIIVSDNLDKRVKKVDASVETVPVEEVINQSEVLRLLLSYDANNVSVLPFISFSGQDKKISIKPEIIFYHKDLKRNISLEIFKKFNFKELLGIGLKGNFFLFDKYPKLYEYISAPDIQSNAFRSKVNEAELKQFADEVVSFTKKSFMLDFENALEFMQTETPLVKGLMDYKSSFMELVEYKQFDQVNYLKIGNAYFLKISYLKQKPFDLLIPLMKSDGRIFKVQFDRSEGLPAVSSKFYKFTLTSSDWLLDQGKIEPSETLNSFSVFDYLYRIDPKKSELDPEKSKALYGFYFEKSGQVINGNDEEELKLMKKSLEGIIKVFESLKLKVKPITINPENMNSEDSSVENSPEDIQQKLIDNLKLLKDALEAGDKSFFENV